MQQILTVSDLTAAIKKNLESSFSRISVQGEISNLKKQASGHIYFTLKDESSQISSVLFRGSAAALSRLPKDGDKVVLFGEINVYPPRGSYQIIVRSIEYSGTGELLKKFHELKEKLKNLGWFDLFHKKPLPPFPKKIGVVTSPTGAVIQDIIHVLQRRAKGFHLILNPVKVQGEGAAEEIAKAIRDFDRLQSVDVIIVCRGGGSLEDLWAFNEEIVAKAVFECRIPIISAVGHETDTTLIDFVADVRAPTPSAAAEIVLAEKSALLSSLETTKRRLSQTLLAKIQSKKNQLKSYRSHPILRNPFTLLHQFEQMVDGCRDQLSFEIKQTLFKRKLLIEGFRRQTLGLNPLEQIAFRKKQFETVSLALKTRADDLISTKKERLKSLISHLRAIDPKNLLKKGFTILFSEKKDSVIFSSKDLNPSQKVSILFHDGEAGATINEIK